MGGADARTADRDAAACPWVRRSTDRPVTPPPPSFSQEPAPAGSLTDGESGFSQEPPAQGAGPARAGPGRAVRAPVVLKRVLQRPCERGQGEKTKNEKRKYTKVEPPWPLAGLMLYVRRVVSSLHIPSRHPLDFS